LTEGLGSVLDASALLALALAEPGADVVAGVLRGSACSAVNWSEFSQKAAQRGIDVRRARTYAVSAGVTIVPFDREDAEAAALLWERARRVGLSLGDRACLALALRLGAPAYTADRSWVTLGLTIDVRAIR
jgi:ribonuclease VapC